MRDVALVRIEQLYPFPSEEYEAVLTRYPNAREVVWCQEEPQNQGAWYQIRHRLQEAARWDAGQVLYAGRAPAAAPATGISKIHEAEQQRLIDCGVACDRHRRFRAGDHAPHRLVVPATAAPAAEPAAAPPQLRLRKSS